MAIRRFLYHLGQRHCHVYGGPQNTRELAVLDRDRSGVYSAVPESRAGDDGVAVCGLRDNRGAGLCPLATALSATGLASRPQVC